MWFTVKISTSGYLLLFELLQLGCSQDIIFEDSEETGHAYASTPQSSSPTSRPTPPSRVTTTLPYKSCPVPPQPDNGEWRIHPDFCEKGNVDCKVPSGTRLRQGYRLVYKCSSGYQVIAEDTIDCTVNGYWSSYPYCVEDRCGKFREYTSTAVYSGPRLNDYANDGGWYYFVPITTKAEVSCKPGYKAFGKDQGRSDVVTCDKGGIWHPSPIKCVPVDHNCGRQDFSGGSKGGIGGWSVTDISEIPWQATLYKEKRSAKGTIKTFICGATLIKYNFVMTAAHCVYDEVTQEIEDAKKLYILVGNLIRDYDHIQNVNGQRSVVRKVHLPFDYYGLRGNYGSDIALLELQEPFDYYDSSWPACLGSSRPGTLILEKGALGKVAGFGRTATEDSSLTLQALRAPYVPYGECHAPSDTSDNNVFITRDKFCAGYTNGTVVCDGDSGGGLVFSFKNVSYVMGVVSVSLGVDLSNGERTCSKHALTVYTKVSEYIDWIEKVIFDPQEASSEPLSRLDTQPPITRPFICVSPEQPTNGQWKLHPTDCSDLGRSANCSVAAGVELDAGTTLVCSCNDGYEVSGSTDVYCTRSGRWSNPPECVTSNPLTNRRTLDVQNGAQEEVSEFPWQAGVYEEKNTPTGKYKQFRCVATMIKPNLVLTARKCVYDKKTNTTLDPNKLFVMAGNIHADYDSPLHDPKVVRKSGVEVIHENCAYIGKVGLEENSDFLMIALLLLEQPFQFTGDYQQPLPKVEGYSEALRDLDLRRNVFIFRTARGPVVCHDHPDLYLWSHLNVPWLGLDLSSHFNHTT